MGRTFVIGDVHGMWDELVVLLGTLGLTKEDTLVSVGDLVDKGPDSVKVVQSLRGLRQQGYKVVLVGGNHEAKHVIFRPLHAKGKGSGMKGHAELVAITEALSPEDVAFLESAVLFHRLPEFDALVVHAGVPGTITELPEVAPGLDSKSMGRLAQLLRVRHTTAKPVSKLVVEIEAPVEYTDDMTVAEFAAAGTAVIKNQVVKPVGSFLKLGDEGPEDPFWAEVYGVGEDKPRFGHVYFGHSPFVGDKPAHFPHATGLDTGAVFGGSLTAAVLVPGKPVEFVSVQAEARDGWEFAKPLDAYTE